MLDVYKRQRFYNTDGALGYRPDDSYFNEKMVTLARLRNYTLEKDVYKRQERIPIPGRWTCSPKCAIC